MIKIIVICFFCIGFCTHSYGQSSIRYYNQSNAGFAYGLGNIDYSINYKESIRPNKQWSVDIYTINGIQVKSQQLGIGVGIDVWKNNWLIPLFFNYSCTFLKERRVSPHAALDLGYAFGRLKSADPMGIGQKDDLGSVLVRPRVGVVVKINTRLNFVAYLFYKMQSFRGESWYGNYNVYEMTWKVGYYKYPVHYHFIGVNVGVKI